MKHVLLASVALCAVASPALAAEVVARGSDLVVLPLGDWIQAVGQTVDAFVKPLLGTAAIAAIVKVAPAARFFLTDELIRKKVGELVDYGVNDVIGATKGMHFDVHIGSQVLAAAVRRMLDRMDANAAFRWLVKIGGGPQEMAKKIFRTMHLDETAGAANVLDPMLQQMDAGTFWKPVARPVAIKRPVAH